MANEDRRAVIEAALDAVEENAPEVTQVTVEEPVQPVAEQQPEGEQSPVDPGPSGEQPPEQPQETPPEQVPPETPPQGTLEERAPSSWKAPLHAKWSTLDPEVRQEVWRREKEVTRALEQSTQARQIARAFAEAAQPYSARLKAQGANPLVAFQNLLLADHRLSSGTRQQRAAIMANLIKDYEVDVGVLDSILAGQTDPKASEEDRIAKLLDQKLAPVQQQLRSYQEREQEAEQEQEKAFRLRMEAMAADSTKYPFFDQARDAMADLIEISATRGVSLDLETAYNRAVAADPNLISQLELNRSREQLTATAQRAQRAKQASLSITGSPSGTAVKGPQPQDRRATIAAAFDALGG